MKNIKTLFMRVFESMLIAWVWLFIMVLHIIFMTDIETPNAFTKIIDTIVFITCFLMYPYASGGFTLWPFFMQFVFWWLFGAAMMWLYRRLSKARK